MGASSKTESQPGLLPRIAVLGEVQLTVGSKPAAKLEGRPAKVSWSLRSLKPIALICLATQAFHHFDRTNREWSYSPRFASSTALLGGDVAAMAAMRGLLERPGQPRVPWGSCSIRNTKLHTLMQGTCGNRPSGKDHP